MRTSAVLGATLLLLILCCASPGAEEVTFVGGHAELSWAAEGGWLEIDAAVANGEADAHVWVLTVTTRRFDDGLFAWQLHLSEAVDSVLVLPNDFLTARHFTTDQLGIETALSPDGCELVVRIPTNGPIPNFVAPGDVIEFHALWIQQPPLASVVVAAADTVAVGPAGGGGDAVNTDPAASPLPTATAYRQGDPIAHCFVLPDSPDHEDGSRAVLSYTLMAVRDGRASEFARFAHITYDAATGTYAYSIDTSSLAAGAYRLLIGSSDGTLATQMDLSIEPAND